MLEKEEDMWEVYKSLSGTLVVSRPRESYVQRPDKILEKGTSRDHMGEGTTKLAGELLW